MIKKLLFFFIAIYALLPLTFAQTRQQYFDGADTVANIALFAELDTASTNVWQIGPPQKLLFKSAATLPNVIITDTINNVPVNNVSRFYVGLKTSWWKAYGVLAIRWKQKLDMTPKADGGIVEYSTDSGKTWINIFNSNDVHNLYGFNTINVDTLMPSNEKCFTGTDTLWKDIWLCFNYSVLGVYDSLTLRYTLKTGAIDDNREGWMIDNMMAHVTYVHTVAGKKIEAENGLLIYPTITNGLVHIDIADHKVLEEVRDIKLMNMDGRLLQHMNRSGARNQLDLSGYPDGNYILTITKGKDILKYKLVLAR